MSGSGKDGGKPGPPSAHAGGVKHDARGNAVWQWAVDTGRQTLDSTSRLLKRLEVPGLRIEGDAASGDDGADRAGAARDAGGAGEAGGGAAASGAAPRAPQHKPPGQPAMPVRAAGYDPYGGAGSVARSRPDSQAARKPAAAVRKPAAAAAPRRSLWQRLFRRS